jgi:hypothetical protein
MSRRKEIERDHFLLGSVVGSVEPFNWVLL